MQKAFRQIVISLIITCVMIPSASANFLDVVHQSLFYYPVEYFSSTLPIIDQNEEFRPLDSATKAEFFKLLIGSTGYLPEKVNADNMPFDDIEINEWYAPYALEALNTGLITQSVENPSFNGGNSLSRYEAVELAFRFYGIQASEDEEIAPGYIDVDAEAKYATLAKTAYNMRIFSDYKSRHFSAQKAITRAETVHMLYQIHMQNPDPFITGM